MRRFLFLALIAGLLAPTAVIAETFYLYWGTFLAKEAGGRASRYGSTHLHSSPFDSLESCESAGQRILSEIYMPIKYFDGRYVCVKK